MVTAYFRKVREFFARNYHQHVRVDGEQAMDNLMGTMLGVLFLAVISASFAGIFMAYTVSTAKATENTARTNLVVKYSTNTLNNLYIESINGKKTAQAAGWTVLSHYNKLSAASPALNPAPSSAFTDFTFAATRPLVAGGSTIISQWGINKNGLVTVYTATSKAGIAKTGATGSFTSRCDWTTDVKVLEAQCIVSIDTVQSVVAPPIGVRDEKALRWQDEIVQYPWTNSAYDWADDTKRDVKTQKLGVIDTSGIAADPVNPNEKTLKYVVMFENLTPGKKVSLDFVESTAAGTLYSHSFVPTLQTGEAGLVARSSHGTLNIPVAADNITVYLDTDVDQTDTASDQTVKMTRFVVYNMK
jgi:hypothetical protein